MSELEAGPARDVTPMNDAPSSAHAATTKRMLAAARLTFAAGCGLGWLFRQELAYFLTEPWRVPGSLTFAAIPSSVLLRWYLHTSVTVGALLALPLATWLGWELVARRSCPHGARSLVAFLVLSYGVLGLGLGLAAFVAFPAFVEAQYADWGFVVPPLYPGAFIETELRWSLDVALEAQVAAVLVECIRKRR